MILTKRRYNMANQGASTPKKNIASRVTELIGGTVADLGYTLWDVEFVKEGAEWFLRVTLDSEEGISIDDCEKVHRAIDPILDEADPIETSYRLEVCSPGLERDLKTPAHYEFCKGWDVTLKLFTSLDGRKTVNGVLEGYDAEKDEFTVNENGEEVTIPKKAVSKIKTVFDFDKVDLNN